MHLHQRINLLAELGGYLLSDDPDWRLARDKAHRQNGWFIPEFIDRAVRNIALEFLQKDKLMAWASAYQLPEENKTPKTVGLVMAGNIPLVGFHDFLTLFLSGHRQVIKPSSKDETLIRHLADRLIAAHPSAGGYISFAERLNGCDAYIATGSNNSARYFEYYFGKYPHIIRRNRTSVAILDSSETPAELEKLADDVFLYFGLGCRNVTKIYAPEDYDFVPLLKAFSKYDYLADFSKYKNNYDYQLAILILNRKYYMSNDVVLIAEEPSVFSPISVLHLAYYKAGEAPADTLRSSEDIQCIVGHGKVPFGRSQQPSLTDYADGVDTLQFLLAL
ncbi:MAG: acyl-CoA reductase [Puia sp.]|nr:acyl-CoA reductase [Puia sp.]